MTAIFTYEDCLRLYKRHVGEPRPIRPEVLKSALGAPFQSFGGQDLFPTIQEKAARLGFGIAEAQAFIDGNKRIAFLSMQVYLAVHGLTLRCTQEEVVDQFIGISKRTVSVAAFSAWLIAHTTWANPNE